MREAVVAAENIAHAIAGEPLKAFRYKTVGMLASLGHHTGVAKFFGMKFSGFVAWWMWRSVYLAKLPRLAKKLRVAVDWTLDLFFGREIEQTITARDIEATAEQIGRVRARRSLNRKAFNQRRSRLTGPIPMPFDKLKYPDELWKERRKGVQESLATISVDELRKS